MAATTILLLLLAATAASAADLSVYHNVHPLFPSPLESIIALARADDARLLFLSSKTTASPGITSAPVASGQAPPSHVVRTGLGTPGQPCPANQVASAALPACAFSKPFADASFQASLGSYTLRLGKDAISNFAFGCVGAVTGPTTNLPKQGLLGLGRGPMSLLSQTGSRYNGVFSYCLPSYKSYYFSGSLRLGAAGQPRNVRYTPLLSNPHRPSLYHVNVTGLSVGRTWVKVPAGAFAFDANTGAGTVIDSGSVITRWTAPVYAALREEFRRQVGAPSGNTSLGAFDTCFNTDEVAAGGAPAVTLHMDGGVDLALPMENTVIHSSATPLACLAMAEAPQNVNSVVNVVANLQQQNLRVVVDVAGSRVGFAREPCN
ncbi:protein ASPARTIC PROTEASE IN GUARD CELL 2 [Panicum miliaceum]|uniref:Protein ASPARTIC PROTEASE IN GUARD CELL 2 n=1 Tax=Panicum miliaceum TaxID=4540 RepID=A0A3L6SDM0_PANMI|nr:protein ASPARTIC PROTEASE IN GUARD CELL 2 [Panicum miliaceum]